MNVPSLANASIIAFGFVVFWSLEGWAVLGETLSPDNPHPRSPGRNGFVAGQAFSIAGITCLAMLCARGLNPWIQEKHLAYVPLGIAAAIYLLEAVWIWFGHPLPKERLSIEHLSFSAGRDLILRNGTALFLGQGLLATIQGAQAAKLNAGGICLGWGVSVLIWDAKQNLSFQRSLRFMVGPMSLVMGVFLLLRAWQHP